MEMKQTILRAANTLVNTVVVLALCLAGFYSVFALWDNNRIYTAAADVQADMIKLKPEITSEDGSSSADFSALREVNDDVCAWISLDNTAIDYPVLQGETNHSYINTDVYGEFALAGSIFLDSRNDNTFTDTYSLLYGHHMKNSKMFGDLDLYKDAEFFRLNRTGTLVLPDRVYHLEILSCLLAKASEDAIFNPTQWQDENITKLYDYIKENALYVHNDMLTELSETAEPVQIQALSTCSSEFTDARTIVLTVMEPYESEELGGQIE